MNFLIEQRHRYLLLTACVVAATTDVTMALLPSGIRFGVQGGSSLVTYAPVRPRAPFGALSQLRAAVSSPAGQVGGGDSPSAGGGLKLPERFPLGSTLVRPEVTYSEDILAESDEVFIKHRPSLWQAFRFRLKPFGRIPSNTKLLEIDLAGEIPLQASQSLFSPGEAPSLTDVTRALSRAAQDPRVLGVLINVGEVSASTATIVELRRAMQLFRKSEKLLWGFAPRTLSINQLCILGGCETVVAVPEAYVTMNGFSLEVDFLGEVFEKIGLEPQVRRIGEFKSFGDRFSRTTMSEAHREVMETILGALSSFKLGLLGRDAGAGKGAADVEALSNQGPVTPKMLKEFGLLDKLMYQDQVVEAMFKVLDRKVKDKPTISLGAYLRRTKVLKVEGVKGEVGDASIAVIIAEGAIVASKGQGQDGNLVVEQFEQQVKRAVSNPSVKGVVVRVNSPGGDALASDLMWRKVRTLSESGKPVVASICNVAASGGYYIAMACEKIVCDELSITGSIGVVQAKFALTKLFQKVGYKVERVSRGKYAELFAAERGFTPEEDEFWSNSAMQSYEDFVSKAAASRSMPLPDMHRRAQGRVWMGAQAKELGLVDALGGLDTAVELCRDMVDRQKQLTKKISTQLAKSLSPGAAETLKNLGMPLGKKTSPVAKYGARRGNPEGDESYVKFVEDKVIGEAKKQASEAIKAEEKQGEGEGKREGEGGGIMAEARLALAELSAALTKLEEEVSAELESDRAKADDVASADAGKKAKKRKTKVLYIGAPEKSFFELLGDVFLVTFARVMHMGGRGSIPLAPGHHGGVGSGPGGSSLLAALSKLSGEEMGRPLAILDDTVGRAVPGIGGVPEELRRLGVGPLLHQAFLNSPGLAEALTQEIQRLGVSAVLSDKLEE